MPERRRLEGRRALVTGAANGIGRATALRLVYEGARVAFVDIEEEPLRAAAAEAVGDAHSLVADVRDEEAIARATRSAEERFGGIDLVIANAAVEPADDARADQLDLDVWRRVIDTNLTGTFLTCKHGLRALLRSEGIDRSLIITVSPTGIRGMAPGQDAYSSSKAGVIGLMRVLAADYAPEGIRVNGVMPGFTATRAADAILADPDQLAAINALIPMRRPATPDEIAAMMAWVASDDAGYCTGAVFTVDGGMTAI
jgi:NAD(P)-dependent dehydrogenase (short-subunit alcohol dehydrogenase family)